MVKRDRVSRGQPSGGEVDGSLGLIYAILFLSGFCSLTYQVTWLRLLRMIFGASTPATSVVLAIFMGGLGFGGLLLGRRAQRAADPLGLYARIEIGIAVTAAASPLLVALASQVYLWLGGSAGLGLPGSTVLRLALSVLVLGVPATLMGGTLPAVAQAMERASDRGRRRVAAFYGVNTAGAVAGAFLATFFLIELLGVRQSLWLAAALNLLLGLQARSMARRARGSTGPDAARPPEGREETGSEPAPAVWLVLLAAFVVGFVFFQMEIVWYRMLGPILGGTLYTFGLILTVALAGIGAGGGLYALGSRDRRPTLHALAVTCALEALALIGPFALGDRVAHLAVVVQALSAQGFTALNLGWAFVAALVVLPAAIVAGYQFPQLVALLGAGRRRVGLEVGLAYAWNTWGAILGALAGGFVLLPLLSAPRLWRLSSVLLAGLALALAVADRRRGRRWFHRAAPAALAAASLLSCLAPGPSAYWRHSGIGAGRAEAAASPRDLTRKILESRRTILEQAEGVESSVALSSDFGLALLINGKSDGHVGDAPTTVMLGMLGAFLHPAPREAMVIGLGSGMTAGWLARVPGVERVDVAELEPAVVRLARRFASMTFDVTELDNVRMTFGDGRELVRTSPGAYDLIISEPSNPYRAGVADLFSREFYLGVRDRLAGGGLFVQWLQTYEVDADVVRLAYATILSVFDHVETWQVHQRDLLLVASREGVDHDVGRIFRRVAEEPFRSSLLYTWRVGGVEGLYTGYLGGTELSRRVAGESGAVSTDDRPLIEFGFARNLGRQGLFNATGLQALAREVAADRPASRGPAIDWDLVRELRQARQAGECFVQSRTPADLPSAERERLLARFAYGAGDLEEAGARWRSQAGDPVSLFDRLLVAEVLASRPDPEAAGAIAELRRQAPTDATLLEAVWRFRRNEPGPALERLVEGFAALADDPWSFDPILERALELVSELARRDADRAARLYEALRSPFAAYRFDHLRRLKLVELAVWAGWTDHCVDAFEPFEPDVVWKEHFLIGRRACYEATAHPLAEKARADLETFRADRPRPLHDPLRPAGPGASATEALEQLMEVRE